jgi:anaerobic magnesium-protoporphyrin IX monomethyl ester cyclase
VADVLLTHSYHLPYDRKQVRKMQPYPPLGTLYAAAVLRHHKISVAVFDAMLTDPAEGFKDALRKHRPKIVAIYEDDFNFLTKMCLTRMREVAWQMLLDAKSSGCRVVAHGSDATDHAQDYLRAGFDFVLVGEAEQTLLDLVNAVALGTSTPYIPGVLSLASPAAANHISSHALPANLRQDHFPFPARDLIDLEPYRDAWLSAHGTFSLNLVAGRGCPFRCNWCAKPIFGDTYRSQPPEAVAQEMQILKERYAAQHLWFADDIFALNRHWVRQLAVEVEKRGCALPFKVQARTDLMTPETIAALKRAGCAEIWMGVESGSQKILDAMDKGLRVEQVHSARANLRREGIRACFFLQFGYPGESWADIRKTIALVRETRPDDIGVSFSYPLPNTKFYELVRQQLGQKRNWSDSDDLCVMFKGAYTDAFYRAIRDALHAEVDSWKTSVPTAVARQSANFNELWREVDALEPASRNADATQIPIAIHSSVSSAPGVCRSSDLVSIRPLQAAAGEG